MHTTYIDVAGLNCYSPPKTEISIRYGLTGLMKKARVIDLVLSKGMANKPRPQDDSVKFYITAKNSDRELKDVLEFLVLEKTGEMLNTNTDKVLQNLLGTAKSTRQEAIVALRNILRTSWSLPNRDAKLNEEILKLAAGVAGYKMNADVPLKSQDIAERKRLALEYKSILSAERNNAGRGANEVVIAYREYGSDNGPKKFPMFTELDLSTNTFYVIGDDLMRTGASITDHGVCSGM
jgi:hypothetical protein